MQELEKILEEIEAEHLMCRCKNNEVCSYPESIGCCYDEAIRKVLGIIRKHMNDGWIPIEDGTPEPYQQVLVSMYNNLTYVTIGHYNGTGWNVHEYITDLGIDVKAWRPLPQPYHPERSKEE